ncbi:MAG: response regulator transcription factor [Gammaproteobacteria bacterium]|nr:response regulator transcription factor [Gammaproteobacteria bacterium]
MTPLRIGIVEDDEDYLSLLIQSLSITADLQCIGTATTVKAGFGLLCKELDVLVADLGLPDGSGLELVKPAQLRGTKVLVLTVFGDEKSVVTAITLGAVGYLIKDNANIPDAIRAVSRGESPLTPSVATYLLAHLREDSSHLALSSTELSRRENDTLQALSRGLTYKEIAAELGVSYHTVSDHLKAVYRKLGVTSRAQAVYKGLHH